MLHRGLAIKVFGNFIKQRLILLLPPPQLPLLLKQRIFRLLDHIDITVQQSTLSIQRPLKHSDPHPGWAAGPIGSQNGIHEGAHFLENQLGTIRPGLVKLVELERFLGCRADLLRCVVRNDDGPRPLRLQDVGRLAAGEERWNQRKREKEQRQAAVDAFHSIPMIASALIHAEFRDRQIICIMGAIGREYYRHSSHNNVDRYPKDTNQ